MTPENLPLWPLYVLGGIAVCWIFMALFGALPVFLLWKARIETVSEEEAQELLHLVSSSGKVSGTWAIKEGFEPNDVFRLKSRIFNLVIVGWRRIHPSTYLCAYVIMGSRIELDLVSYFGSNSWLETFTSRDGQLFPTSPDCWLQSFTVSDASELWDHHKTALEYLKRTANLQPVDHDTTLEENFVASLQHQSRYIRSIPFWLLRFPYWHFVRCFTRHNKPLAELK